MSNTGTQAIDRAVQLLTRVVEADEPLTFTELSADPGLPRSTPVSWRAAGIVAFRRLINVVEKRCCIRRIRVIRPLCCPPIERQAVAR